MIQARPYQIDAENAIFNYFASGKTGNPVVAMPTASGKSIVIANFSKHVLQTWHNQRILIGTHVKELIEQNYRKMMEAWDTAPAGVFSAGLQKRDKYLPIIFGGVQSMVNCAPDFGWRDLFLIDEAHLVSGKDDSNYGKVIASLRAINPHLKVIGFSATPWRIGNGHISDGPVFTDICYDITGLRAFNQLIKDGYLCPLVPKRTKTELNVSDVAIQNGDFVQNQLQAAVDKDSITHAACKEMLKEAADRQSWLIFASGLDHSDHIAEMLQSFGVNAVSVHSKIDASKRDKAIRDFKSGELRCIVNNNVLTTGFDHPGLDFIGMLRPTASAALWVQMLGRGTRPSPQTHKQNCLVLDFAGNTKRLGPINDPVIPKKRGSKSGVAPVRICPKCDAYNHARATECFNCGHIFEMSPKIKTYAGTEELIKQSDEIPVIETFNVAKVIYHRYNKGIKPILMVSYHCGMKMFPEYVCLEHSGLAGKKARDWWRLRMGLEPPNSVDEALKHVAQLKVPRQIRVWTNGKYPEVMAVAF